MDTNKNPRSGRGQGTSVWADDRNPITISLCLLNVPRFCRRCGWGGDDRQARIIESWFSSSPSYSAIWPAYPRCSARIERR
jgi:hypothetical protein